MSNKINTIHTTFFGANNVIKKKQKGVLILKERIMIPSDFLENLLFSHVFLKCSTILFRFSFDIKIIV